MINKKIYQIIFIFLSIFLGLALINIYYSKDYSNYNNEYEKNKLVAKKLFDSNPKQDALKYDSGADTLMLSKPWPIDGIIVNGSKNQYKLDSGIWPSDGILTSKNRQYRAVLYTDGQIAVENVNNINIWISPTHTEGRSYAKFLNDGDFALFNEKNNKMTWHTNTAGSGADKIVMESSGSFILYAGTKVIWSSEPSDMAIFKFFLGIEPVFSIIQIALSEFIPFYLFVCFIVFFSLALKFSAIINIYSKAYFLYFVPYLLVLGFLHEGTQIRIGLALSVAIWSIIFYCRFRFLLAAITLIVAIFIHVSVVIIATIYVLDFLQRKSNKYIFTLILLLFTVFGFVINHIEIYQNYLSLIHPRIESYFSQNLIDNQNSSGLFIFYIPFIAGIILYARTYYIPTTEFLRRFYNYSILSGLIGLIFLILLSSNVIVSSRLAEVLIFPCLIILGGALYQNYLNKKFLIFTLGILWLLVYFLARSYVIFFT